MIADIGRHVADGASPTVAFQSLAPAERSPAPAPLFLLGPANAQLHEEIFGQAETGEVGTYALDDVVVAPSGIAIKDGVAFSSTAFIHPPHHVEQVAARVLGTDLPRRHIEGTLAVIYGPGHQTYGHWLVDFLPRLWVLAQTGHDLASLRYVMPPELTSAAKKLLALAGIARDQLVAYRYWREVLTADRLLLPTGLRAHNRIAPCFAPATRFWTGRLRAASRARPNAALPTRIFVSRARVTAARILDNRARIEAIAAERGYEVMHPQTMELGLQAALFSGARIIVGEYGSALHGSVFSGPGAVSVGLRGTARHPSFVQSGVAAALGQQAGYVLGQTTLGHTPGETGQVFSVQPEDFERALDIAECASEAGCP